ncbi:hypothetical protein F4782DRAFT_496375 [Xylaria castorea]|nr:hypothetical protein F4782DRAFT_496375 [Xylaria castorea]
MGGFWRGRTSNARRHDTVIQAILRRGSCRCRNETQQHPVHNLQQEPFHISGSFILSIPVIWLYRFTLMPPDFTIAVAQMHLHYKGRDIVMLSLFPGFAIIDPLAGRNPMLRTSHLTHLPRFHSTLTIYYLILYCIMFAVTLRHGGM